MSCTPSSYSLSPSADAASFASFLLRKGPQMTRLDVPLQLSQTDSPPLLPQLLVQYVALTRLSLTPSAAQWDTLPQTLPSHSRLPSRGIRGQS